MFLGYTIGRDVLTFSNFACNDYYLIVPVLMGDLFTSLIHTCDLNKVNSFDYLTELQRHAAGLKANPTEWMPWNYRDTLARPPGG